MHIFGDVSSDFNSCRISPSNDFFEARKCVKSFEFAELCKVFWLNDHGRHHLSTAWYIERSFVINMTSLLWLWRHRLLPPAFFYGLPFLSWTVTINLRRYFSSKITRALSFLHSSISISLFNGVRSKALFSGSSADFMRFFLHLYLFWGSCLF